MSYKMMQIFFLKEFWLSAILQIYLKCLLVKCNDMMQILFLKNLLVKCNIIVMQMYLKCL